MKPIGRPNRKTAGEPQRKRSAARPADYRKEAEKKLGGKKQAPRKELSRSEIEELLHELAVHQVELEIQNEDLRATRDELQASRDRYADLYNFAPVGYFSLDDNGHVIDVNLTGAAQLGLSRKQVVGIPFGRFVADDSRSAFYAHLNAVFSSRSRHRCGLKIRRICNEGRQKKGSFFNAELESFYTETENGSRGCRMILSDISERKEAEAAVQKMNETVQRKNIQLEEASRARNRLFSFISHELKTPLNSIVGFTHLLDNGTYGPLSPEQKRVLLRLAVNTEEMVRLINNILDLARMEVGKVDAKRIRTNVRELLERIIISFEPFIREKELFLESRFAPDAPKTVSTDPEKVRSIVTNLLSNAVKFTRTGAVRLEVTSLPTGGGIRLVISDTGIGIAPEDLERIFEEYERSGFVQENPIRYTGGTGLGLSIVKRMVDLLGGAIRVESRLGEGTTFTVDLPETESR